MHASTNLAEIHFSGRISAKYCRGPKEYHLAPSRKIFHDNSTFSYSCMILYFDELIWRKPIFSHLGRFGYKKASKIQKNLFFQNLQICAILSIYTLLGIFLASKKLCQLEARSTPFYLVMDDPIMYVFSKTRHFPPFSSYIT